MKRNFLLIAFFVINFSFAQSINDYKYAIVPATFSFLKEKDQYRLNTLAKLYLEKQGFVTYFDTDVMPEDLINNNCTKVYLDLKSSGNFISTKLQFTIKDCKGTVLFTSEEGRSKEKDYYAAYTAAFRATFPSFDAIHYKYSGKTGAAPAAEAEATNTPVISAVATAATGQVSSVAAVAPTEGAVTVASDEILFAQPIANGYQLIDSSPKVILKIYKSSNANSFIAVKGNLQGIMIQKDAQWFFEYYQNAVLLSEKIGIRF